MTDLGWKDESYFECPLHGEDWDCDVPVSELLVERFECVAPLHSVPAGLEFGAEAAVGQIVRDLGLSAGELEAFQSEVCGQGRNWRLVLICAFDAGCRRFRVLMSFVEGTRR